MSFFGSASPARKVLYLAIFLLAVNLGVVFLDERYRVGGVYWETTIQVSIFSILFVACELYFITAKQGFRLSAPLRRLMSFLYLFLHLFLVYQLLRVGVLASVLVVEEANIGGVLVGAVAATLIPLYYSIVSWHIFFFVFPWFSLKCAKTLLGNEEPQGFLKIFDYLYYGFGGITLSLLLLEIRSPGSRSESHDAMLYIALVQLVSLRITKVTLDLKKEAFFSKHVLFRSVMGTEIIVSGEEKSAS